ncbi:MAG: hypothetical protein AB1324_01710 [Candidatus Micrarchaeota archaeon]
MIAKPLMEKIAQGDIESITHFQEILRLGVIEKDDVPGMLSYVVEGMAKMSEKGEEGVRQKFALFSIATQLNLMLLPQSDLPKKDMAVRELWDALVKDGKSRDVSDKDIETVQRYEDLVAVAFNGPEKALGKLPQSMQKAAIVTAENSFRQIISTGAALAKMAKNEIEPDARYVQAAEACLQNAAKYGNEQNRKYAAECLEHVPTAMFSACKTQMGAEYDASLPQGLYAEFVFRTIESVYSPKEGNGKAAKELETAVGQLVIYAAKRGEIELMFDSGRDKANLDGIMARVEDALLFALERAPEKETRERAAEGLEAIGSDRIEECLGRLVKRYGKDNSVGFLAHTTLENIESRKYEEIEIVEDKPLRLPPPKPMAQPPRIPVLKNGLVQ